MTFGSFFKGALVAVVSFAMLGTVAAPMGQSVFYSNDADERI